MKPFPWTSKMSVLMVTALVLLATSSGLASAQGSDPPPSTPMPHSNTNGAPHALPGSSATPEPPTVPVPSGKDPYWDKAQSRSGISYFPSIYTLYDQYNSAGIEWISSQDFELAWNAFDSFAADDFVVPTGSTWTITQVEVDGEYFNGSGPASAVNIFIFSDSGGVPGSLVNGFGSLTATPGPGAGDFVISTPPIVLIPGTYWISIQAIQDFTPNGQWGWTDRTVTSYNSAVWQNPGDGFSTGCTTWSYRGLTCGFASGEPDQVFRLSGTAENHYVLYDQYNFPQSGGTSSQDFETGYDTFDGQAADDFVVPPGDTWTLTQVEVDGLYLGTGPVAAVNVFIYRNSFGIPFPWIAWRTGILPYWGPEPGDLAIPIAPLVLTSGTYWVSVQAVMDYGVGGQWMWSNRTTMSGYPAVWQNPGGGFGMCPTWEIRGATCGIDAPAPDQVFRLIGVRSVFLPLIVR